MKLNRSALLAGILCLFLPLIALADNEQPQIFEFAVGWRDTGARIENVLQIGVIYPCEQGRCADVEEFHGAENLPRQLLKFKHEMHVTSGAKSCKDGYIGVIRGSRTTTRGIAVEKSGQHYTIKLGRMSYTWAMDEGGLGGYVLRDVYKADSQQHGEQPIGYAYWSADTANVHFRADQFKAYFDGQIAHKDMLTPVEADWLVKPSSIHLERFIARDSSSPVLSLTTAGAPDTLKRLNRPVEVEYSVLPPDDTATDNRLRYFISEYGHDFNANGCFDEPGHNKLMLPVVRNASVIGFVYVEYSPDVRDHVPMISVGRYFRK